MTGLQSTSVLAVQCTMARLSRVSVPEFARSVHIKSEPGKDEGPLTAAPVVGAAPVA